MTGTNTAALHLGEIDRLLLRTEATELPATYGSIDLRWVVVLEALRRARGHRAAPLAVRGHAAPARAAAGPGDGVLTHSRPCNSHRVPTRSRDLVPRSRPDAPRPPSHSSLVASSSERMSIRQPVSRAARRAFWPSLPMASESWKSGTITRAERSASETTCDRGDPGRRQRVGDQLRRVVGPVDDVDLLAVQLRHHVADPLPHRPDAGALGVDARRRSSGPRSWSGGRPRARSRRSRPSRRRSRAPRARTAS